jgi:hypothetical protein
MHQCTREREDGCVVANLDDYGSVYHLVSEPLSQGLDKSIAPHIKEVTEAVRAAVTDPLNGISVTELAGILGKDVGVMSRNVTAAVKLGYLENRNPGQGHKAVLVPGDRELPNGAVLPHPDELSAMISGHGFIATKPVEFELPY